MYALGVDLGGTNARAAVVDADGRILASAKHRLADRSPQAVVAAIAAAAREAQATAGSVPLTACGVGAAGQLRGESGIIAVAPNLGWREVPLGALLAGAIGQPVRVVNDLKAAAWGEFRAGGGRGVTDLWVMFVGSGVGSAQVTGSRLVLGAAGVAGEFGHVKVEPSGRRCGCGELGCLEAYVGGHNLIAQMRELLSSGRPTALRELSGGDEAKLNPLLLEAAAEARDPEAAAIYDRAVGHLALAVANQITVMNPGKLLLGGGVLSHCPGMRRRIVEGVQTHASATARAAVTITDAELGDDSGLIGSALLALGA